MGRYYRHTMCNTTPHVSIYYKICSPTTEDKPYLVFIHGIFANHTVFKKEADYFKKKGYGILLIDLRGHGKSSKPKQKTAYALTHLVNDVLHVLDREHIQDAVLITHSLGGIIGTEAYKKDPSLFTKIVLIDTPLKNPFHRFGKHMESFLNTRVENFFKTLHSLIIVNDTTEEINFTEKRYSKSIGITGMFAMPFFSARGIWEDLFQFDSKKTFRNVSCPILAFVGTKDYVANLTSAEMIAKLVPHATIRHLQADHYMVVNKASAINKEIKRFISKK